MASGQDYRYDPAAKRSPSKSMPRSVLSSSEIYPGSGTKLRPRQSLRTPQQHVPLKFDDRVKNRRASKSFVLLDQSDLDTPRARIEAFIGAAESVQKILPSTTKTKKSLQGLTSGESVEGLFKSPRVRKLAVAVNIDRSRVSSPGSKLTPRSNVWNLIQTGEEKSPVERTGSVNGAGTSAGTHNLTSVRNAGQRVSVSPIDVSSVGTGKKLWRQSKVSGSGKARRRSFHLSSDQIGIEEYSPQSLSITHSGQRVSISPINVSDRRVDNNEMFETKYKTSRRSFHLDVPHTEEKDEQNENYDDDDDVDNAANWKVSSENNNSHQEDEVDGTMTRNKSSPDSKNYAENSSEDWRKAIPVAKRREEEVTGVLDLVTEHTSLVIGGGTDMITQGTSLGPNTNEISLINHSMRHQRKSSVSKHNVSVGRELSISAVEPVELSEGMESKGAPSFVADQGDVISGGDQTGALNGVKSGDDEQELSSSYEQNQVISISSQNDHQNQFKVNRKSFRDEALEEDKNPVEEPSNAVISKKTTDTFRFNTQEKVVDKTNTSENLNSKNSNEVMVSIVVDPASVYDLSEESSSSRLEGSNTDKIKMRGSNSKQRLSSGKRKTPGSSAKGTGESSTQSVQKTSSSKRKRLEFSELTAAETGGYGSPSQGQTLSNSPRSSTPVDRSRRFFHSTKIQRSVTEFFQGNQDLASASTAMTPRTKDLFSDISPIRPLGLVQKSGEKGKTEKDIAEGRVGDLGNDNEELISKQTSSSKRTIRIDVEDSGRNQSSDEELPSFSSMATPHIDLRKHVFVSSLHRKAHSMSRSKVDKTQQKIVKSNQPKKTAKQPIKAPVTNLPRRTVKYFAELHSDMKLSKDAIEEVEKISEHFWVDSFKALEAYALHAGRKSVQDADVILLMKTQRLISGTDDLHNKIRQLMPMELRKELIPCAYGAPGKK